MSRTMKLNSDNKLPNELQDTVQKTRGARLMSAELHPLPKRFMVEEDKENPSVWIIDTETGVMTEVSLFAYASVRKAIKELIGG